MALTLLTAITATDTVFDVLGSDDLETGDFKTIDSETIVIRRAQVSTLAYGQSARQRVSVYRGSGGTRAASHAASASLATYSGGGGGGVTVDNGSDPPAAVTTLVAPGAVIAGGTATLMQIVKLGPLSVAFGDFPRDEFGPTGPVELADLPAGSVILRAWAIQRTDWEAADPLGFYVSGQIANHQAAAVAYTDFRGTSYNPTGVISPDTAGSESIVMMQEAGQLVAVSFGTDPTAGTADVFALIAMPTS